MTDPIQEEIQKLEQSIADEWKATVTRLESELRTEREAHQKARLHKEEMSASRAKIIKERDLLKETVAEACLLMERWLDRIDGDLPRDQADDFITNHSLERPSPFLDPDELTKREEASQARIIEDRDRHARHRDLLEKRLDRISAIIEAVQETGTEFEGVDAGRTSMIYSISMFHSTAVGPFVRAPRELELENDDETLDDPDDDELAEREADAKEEAVQDDADRYGDEMRDDRIRTELLDKED